MKFTSGEALTAGDALGVTHVASGDVTVNQLEQSDTSATLSILVVICKIWFIIDLENCSRSRALGEKQWCRI